VWDVEPPGDTSWMGYVRQYLMNVALVIGTGFLLLVSLIVTASIGAATEAMRQWIPGPAGVWWAIDGIIGLALTTGFFVLIFKVIPDADVNWRDVGVGAFVTAMLFTAGRLVLGAYLGRNAADSAYGAPGRSSPSSPGCTTRHSWSCLAAEITHVHSLDKKEAETTPIGQRA
jgi:membrane protein